MLLLWLDHSELSTTVSGQELKIICIEAGWGEAFGVPRMRSVVLMNQQSPAQGGPITELRPLPGYSTKAPMIPRSG